MPSPLPIKIFEHERRTPYHRVALVETASLKIAIPKAPEALSAILASTEAFADEYRVNAKTIFKNFGWESLDALDKGEVHLAVAALKLATSRYNDHFNRKNLCRVSRIPIAGIMSEQFDSNKFMENLPLMRFGFPVYTVFGSEVEDFGRKMNMPINTLALQNVDEAAEKFPTVLSAIVGTPMFIERVIAKLGKKPHFQIPTFLFGFVDFHLFINLDKLDNSIPGAIRRYLDSLRSASDKLKEMEPRDRREVLLDGGKDTGSYSIIEKALKSTTYDFTDLNAEAVLFLWKCEVQELSLARPRNGNASR